MDAPTANIIEIEIIHYCSECGWHNEPSKYVNLKALISWTKVYQEEHREVCVGDVTTRCVW